MCGAGFHGLGASIVIVLLAITGAAVAEPKSMTLTPDDLGAVIVAEVVPAPALTKQGRWVVMIDEYSPTEQKFLSSAGYGTGFASDVEQVEAKLIVAKTGATTYAFRMLGESYFQACLNGGSARFDATPGKVTFLGRIHAAENLAEIQAASRDGRIGRFANSLQYVYDTPRLHLTPPAELPGWETRVRAMLAERYPGVTAPVVAAEVKQITFPRGHGQFGAPSCGPSRFRAGKGPR